MGVSTFVSAQNTKQYLIEINAGYELGQVSKVVNPDQTLSLSMSNSDMEAILNSKEIYSFYKAFPTATTTRLQRVYIITASENTTFSELNNRQEIYTHFELDDISILTDDTIPTFAILPNDYEDIMIGGRNQELDLIKAPLAWTITRGDPNILIGVVDSKYDFTHPELQGQIIDNIIIQPSNTPHGTGSVSKINGKTHDGTGISSLGHNLKAVVATCGGTAIPLINGLLQMSQYSGVRVINCSWAIRDSHYAYPYLFEVMQEIEEANPDMLIAASAGNSNENTYRYPASFPNTISVSSVGSKLHIGEGSLIVPGSNPPEYYWDRSWKDFHNRRPDSPSGGATHIHNNKVDVCAPGYLVTTGTDNPNFPSGYALANGTSGAVNFVSGLAGLIYSINPNFTRDEVKNIIRDTADDIYYIPNNQQYLGMLGTGRINAFRAVKTADCVTNPTAGLDLGMQDTLEDYFYEPNTNNSDIFWHSPDIWVRNQNDGKLIQKHENPEYDANNPNYVYVRVTNNSCETGVSFQNKLKLYWSKANTSLAWPEHWDGTLYQTDPVTGQQILMGDEIATLTIPQLDPGESKILEIPFNFPNPADYQNINFNPWHFCLLARIESPNDPMTYAEVSNLRDNIKKNNNIVMKNTTVVDIVPGSPAPQPIGGVVGIGNPDAVANTYDLKLFPEANENGKALYQEAEVTITLDDLLYNAWSQGGKQLQGALEIKPKTIKASNGNALLENIILNPGELGTAYVAFNFLTKELTNKQNFVYHLAQKKITDTVYMGGETFLVNKKQRNPFLADAGTDDEIERNEPITLSAGNISETATYNWYDPNGNLIHTGTTLTISPEMTETYKLEVIAEVDGFKDYDDVTVTVNPYHIESLTPNPASSLVTLNYVIDGSNSAYIMVVNMQSGSSENIILDTTTSQMDLDISNLITGLYNIILICDGETQNSKTLSKN
tara:strand:+ start:69230 stop:72076 length:2847 start_codon:yes stop_codon:yes gene_type:complete